MKMFRVECVQDERNCPDCSPWHGKILSEDQLQSHGPPYHDYHPEFGGCRCILKEIPEEEVGQRNKRLVIKLRYDEHVKDAVYYMSEDEYAGICDQLANNDRTFAFTTIKGVDVIVDCNAFVLMEIQNSGQVQ